MDEKETTEKEITLLKWTSPEYIQYEHSIWWFLGAGTVFIGIVTLSVLQKDWFMVVISFLLVLFTWLYFQKKPQDVQYRVTQIGIYIDDRLYKYNEIHSFWLVVDRNTNILNLIFTKKYLPQLPVLFYGVDPVKIRETLSKYIPEQEERTETIFEKLSRLLKF